MNNTKYLVTSFLTLYLIQLPVIHRFIFFDIAFGFFYIGFFLLLPKSLNPLLALTYCFSGGLVIDLFSNTLGLHAMATLGTFQIRNFWLNALTKSSSEELQINIYEMGFIKFLIYLFPLIIVHHTIIFIVENGSFINFSWTTQKIISSGILSSLVVILICLLIAPKPKS